jgi:Dockerin type I domain
MLSRRRNLMKSAIIMILIVLLSSSVNAQNTKFGYGDVTVQLNGGDDVAYVGENNTIEFWIENDEVLQAMSIAFEFSIGREYQFNPNHGGTGKYVMEMSRAINAFVNGHEENVHINDVTTDSIHFGGAYNPPTYDGIPPGPSELCYTMEVYIPSDQEVLASGFCIDNIFMPPVGNWLFMDNNGTYAPTFQGNPNSSESNPDAPQICFDIVISNDPPAITNCPESPVMQSHSVPYIYVFEASDPDPEDIMHWQLVAGEGTINEFSGEYTFDPAELGLVSVAVRVTDDFGESDTCAFDIEVTNGAPTIANCPDYIIWGHCDMFYYQFEATDPDPGEPLVWTLNSPEGMINPASGEYIFDPVMYEPGSYTVEVVVTDSYGADDLCVFSLDITNEAPVFLNSCSDEIGAFPYQVLLYDFDAVDPDPCNPLEYLIASIFPQPEGDVVLDPQGALTFTPSVEDAGQIFEFIISVTDGYNETSCPVFIEVYEGDDCVNPIFIDSLPFTYVGSTEGYTDAMEPLGCFVEDPLVGIGPDIVFSYMADELDTIYISVDPSTEWDAVIYILSDCNPESCIIWSNDGEELLSEVIEYVIQPETEIYIVVDGVADMAGPFLFVVGKAQEIRCKRIDEDDRLDQDVPAHLMQTNGAKTYARFNAQQTQMPDDNCECGYRLSGYRTYIGRTLVKKYKPRDFPKEYGFARVVATLTGKYEVIPDPEDYVGTAKNCKLSEYRFYVRMKVKNKARKSAGSFFEYKRTIQPFYSDEKWYMPQGKVKYGQMYGGILRVLATSPEAWASYRGELGSVTKDVPFKAEQEIKLTFELWSMAYEKDYAMVRFVDLKFKITCPRKQSSKDGQMMSSSYPVNIEITNVSISDPFRNTEIIVPSDYAWNFIEVDSGDINCGGIDFADAPLFGNQLFLSNRINEVEYSDTLQPDSLSPPDTSALFTLSGMAINPYSASDIISAPSDICFDPYGHFGNMLYIAQTDEFDYDGTSVSGSGSIISIDDQGLLDTLINDLNSPVGLTFTSGPPFGDNMYVADLELGEIASVDPSGTMTTFATGLKCPLDLTIGSGGFGDYLYVAEYDTSFIDTISTPNSGRIVKVDPGGSFTTFVDGLQPVVDLAFGPGGVFGTDLYVALDNEQDDSMVYVPSTGKIVVIDSAGNMTDFATSLNYPEYITFDPSGALYVSAQGGIHKIAQYVCGDANSDWLVNVSDAVYIINYVFVGGNAPEPPASGDANCDGTCNVSDAVWIINYVFVGGNAPCDTNGDTVPDC